MGMWHVPCQNQYDCSVDEFGSMRRCGSNYDDYSSSPLIGVAPRFVGNEMSFHKRVRFVEKIVFDFACKRPGFPSCEVGGDIAVLRHCLHPLRS